jgi:ABC-type sugar transport system permease subunit
VKPRARIHPWLMLGPSLVTWALFVFLPLGITAVQSFFAWDMLTPAQWVGFANYEALAEGGELGATGEEEGGVVDVGLWYLRNGSGEGRLHALGAGGAELQYKRREAVERVGVVDRGDHAHPGQGGGESFDAAHAALALLDAGVAGELG